jgi:hypothetical protein
MRRKKKVFRLNKIKYIPSESEAQFKKAYPKDLPASLKIKAIKKYLQSEGKSIDPLPELAPVFLEENSQSEEIPVFEAFSIS